MKRRCFLAQGLKKPCPVGDQQRPHLAQPDIVVRQYGEQTDILGAVLQNPALLFQDSAVFRQGRLVVGPQGAEHQVRKPPSGSAAAFEDHQILRAKEHRGQHPRKLGSAFLLHPVLPQLPGSSPGKKHPAQGLLPVLGLNHSFQLPKVPGKADHFRRFLGPEALSAAQKGDGFQQIGLSLGIAAHDQVYPRIEGKMLVVIVPKAPQIQLTQLHGR